MPSAARPVPVAVPGAVPPDGKGVADESFPVAWLVTRRLRPAVLTYYRFARTADDVADAPRLSANDKRARLEALERDLREGQGEAAALHHVLRDHALSPEVATDLLVAFRRDAAGQRCESWDDLMEYCRLSAMPVGRFLLALHGERDPAAVSASDALCAALQISNHVQDCGRDWRDLRRLYLPGVDPPWLEAQTSGPPLRAALDGVLARTDTLLDQAAPLPGLLKARGLRMQAAATLHLARSLRHHLAARDPLAERVRPRRLDWLAALLVGLWAGGRR